MSSVLGFSGVSRWYGDVLGVSQVSFELDSGVVGLVGKNGAGKSTIMKLAAGLIAPSLGSVLVEGVSPYTNLDARRRIGLCSDVDKFYEDMSGLRWVTLMARLFGVANARSRAAEILDRLELGEAMNKRIGGYSKGMRQKTKLARALVTEPRVVLLDEPLNGLDPLARHQVIELVREFGREGKAVLVSSHVLGEVEKMTENVLMIHQGRVRATGRAEEIREQIGDRALQVEVRARDIRRLAAELIAFEEVTGVDVAGEHLVARVAKADPFFSRITEIGRSDVYGIETVTPLDADLEAIFEYLVEG